MTAFHEPTAEQYRLMLARDMPESDLVTKIINHAASVGWKAMHQLPAMNAKGRYRTALQGHKGFPDLVLAAPMLGGLLFVECKSHTGSLEPDQRMWRDTMLGGGYEWRLWRPMDWLDGTIALRLSPVDRHLS